MSTSGRSIKSLVCAAVFGSLFWGGLAQLDPLGATSAANTQSEALFSRLFGGPWYPATARDRIAVLLIDDEYLNETGSAWPLSYAQQELLLEDLMTFSPSAVFLDILYQHKHDRSEGTARGLSQLQDRIKSMTSGGTPVFVPMMLKGEIGGDRCASAPQPGVEPLIEGAVTPLLVENGAELTYIGWSGCGDRYPAFVLDDPAFPTPAFALYTHEFAQVSSGRIPDPALYSDAMMVRWGARTSEVSAEGYTVAGLPDCELLDGGGVIATSLHIAEQIWEVLFQTFSQKRQRGRPNACAHTDSVNALWMLGGARDDRNRAWLNEMLRDRIVLVGTQLDGLHDRIVSPVNGQMPGVFLLAMALDNYLTFGKNYYRDMPNRFSAFLEIAVLFCTTVVIGLCWRTSRHRKLILGFTGHRGSSRVPLGLALKVFVIFKLLIPLVASLSLAFVVWRSGFAPLNWIAIVLLVFVQNPVSIADCFGTEDPCRWMSHRTTE